MLEFKFRLDMNKAILLNVDLFRLFNKVLKGIKISKKTYYSAKLKHHPKTLRKSKIIFKEKGVDVKISVDLVIAACDKKLKTAIICSSDSDLQPVIKEIRDRGVEVIYLGFEINPNKGLMYTTDRTILIRDFEILESFLGKL